MNFSHVLISRPEAECMDLAARVRAAGLTPVCIPAFGFTATGETPAADDAWRTATARLLVFTSPRAVAFGVPGLSPDLLDARVAALGPATAAALQAAGLQVDLTPSGPYNSETLLALAELKEKPGQAIIFAAPGGRQALREGLARLGWKVRMAMVYRREPLEPAGEALESLLAADRVLSVWTSASALDRLLDILPEAVRDKLLAGSLLVVSERIATKARARGARHVQVADSPDNSGLLDGIRHLNAPAA